MQKQPRCVMGTAKGKNERELHKMIRENGNNSKPAALM